VYTAARNGLNLMHTLYKTQDNLKSTDAKIEIVHVLGYAI